MPNTLQEPKGLSKKKNSKKIRDKKKKNACSLHCQRKISSVANIREKKKIATNSPTNNVKHNAGKLDGLIGQKSRMFALQLLR